MTDEEKARACADAFAPLVVEATKRCRHFYQAYPDQPDCACAGCIKAAIDRAVATLLPHDALCVECGPQEKVDEEGMCLVCGGSAMGEWLTRTRAAIRARNGGGE